MQTTSSRKRVLWIGLVALLVVLTILLFLIFMRQKRKPVFVILLAIVILASVILTFYIRRTSTGSEAISKTLSGLKPGKEYFWKVIAEDGKGGLSESETFRFKTK
jgi:preprotein translocase subunit YajC